MTTWKGKFVQSFLYELQLLLTFNIILSTLELNMKSKTYLIAHLLSKCSSSTGEGQRFLGPHKFSKTAFTSEYYDVINSTADPE